MALAPPALNTLTDNTKVTSVETSTDATAGVNGYWATNVLIDKDGYGYWQFISNVVLNIAECAVLESRYLAVGWRKVLVYRNPALTETIVELYI